MQDLDRLFYKSLLRTIVMISNKNFNARVYSPKFPDGEKEKN